MASGVPSTRHRVSAFNKPPTASIRASASRCFAIDSLDRFAAFFQTSLPFLQAMPVPGVHTTRPMSHPVLLWAVRTE